MARQLGLLKKLQEAQERARETSTLAAVYPAPCPQSLAKNRLHFPSTSEKGGFGSTSGNPFSPLKSALVAPTRGNPCCRRIQGVDRAPKPQLAQT